MAAEPLIHMVRNAFFQDKSSDIARKKKEVSKPPQDGGATVGILSFEVASAMSRAIILYRSLSDSEIARLRSETLASRAVRLLVSTNEPYLLSLALAEKLDGLNCVAAVASRLGRRCSQPVLLGFEHVYSDLLAGRIDPAVLGLLSKDMDGVVRKMERFVSSTATLYTELEVLANLEQSAKKFSPAPVHEETRRAFEQKIQGQRQDVCHLRGASLWNQSYDKVVHLLARAVCTIYSRIRHVFGESGLGSDFPVSDQSRQLSRHINPSGHRTSLSGLLRFDSSQRRSPRTGGTEAADSGLPFGRLSLGRFHCGAAATGGRLFMECLGLGSSSSWKHDDKQIIENESSSSSKSCGKMMRWPRFGPNSRLTTTLAPPSTLGGSALALHYANVIIMIEKLFRYPDLLAGNEARDDLYQMLPASLKSALRNRLRSYVKNVAIYDAPVAHQWKEALEKILSWLGPMAHDMIRWQSERNSESEQQQEEEVIFGANVVLLLQTLYFADREKADAAICELLVGLNYICRYEQQQIALLDCTSSVDYFDDCMEWHMQG